MTICFIGIGSNEGYRALNIESAIERINRLDKTSVSKRSSIIETTPQGGPAQNNFLNAVIEISTELSAHALLRGLQTIEKDLGRRRVIKNGPRTIDLDILFYGQEIICDEQLVVPHPRMKERDFVLLPLKEIAPHMLKVLDHEGN
ncbi:MAG: 2-amino-4-hydroxy-6-hydroxymethyldihydropteridine diphosphokinase [Candidatus Omnitrophica bacterium]|nr:2-amino-4-hydroxy-6-hydroxymethyldihydropteridine diphosphokinase [Candidatus Omnitrophota bacterium]